jgi:ubiquinone/menaquinone biosynthesis C-methylase UbiE
MELSMKKDYEGMQEHWTEWYQKQGELLREHPLGIYSVCYPNQSRRRNIFTDWLQNRTFQKLLNKCGNLGGNVALDIGTGAGRWAVRLLGRGLKVTAIDSNEEMIERNIKLFPQINFKKMHITYLDFEDNYFDLVTSVTVLHHIPYETQKEVIKEITRVTKDGKHILILESTNTNSAAPSMFANSLTRWTELFRENGCKKLASVGYEYIPLISAAIHLSHLYRRGTKNKSVTSAKEHRTASPRLFHIAETGIILISYPIEIFWQHIVPGHFARQAGILFRKTAL